MASRLLKLKGQQGQRGLLWAVEDMEALVVAIYRSAQCEVAADPRYAFRDRK